MATELREQLQEVLGDTYQIERELPGGMSRVFVAEETALARKVVIKVLPPETAAGVNAARFRREIQLAASLQHPHIVPLLTAGAKGDLLYYVMPLIEGQSLRSKLVKTGEFPVNEVAWILRDAALALAYAHDHGVVHRDIKPDNILLTGNFALVTDFGVAKAVSEAAHESNITSQGVALGTPTYMAPEQAAADPNTDHRADIYALGVVGYELLAGTPPITGASQQAILAAHITQTPENIAKHRPAVPPAMAHIIMRCLEKKPADRWQSADELASQLAAIATPGATTPAATAPYDAAPIKRRDSKKSAIAAAFLLGLAAFAGIAWFAGRDRNTGPQYDDHRIVITDFENQTRDVSLDPVGKLASDVLRQGITQTGVAEVESAALPTDTAKAGLIVRGRYYREGDSIRVQAEIVDARTSRVARVISPAKAPASNPGAAIELLKPRVMGAIAALNDPFIKNWARKATEPPKYEAYRAYRDGIEADVVRAGQTAGATNRTGFDEFVRALSIDSTFVLPLLEIGPGALQSRITDLDRLTPVDRFIVEGISRWRDNDYESAVKAMRQAASLAPDPAILINQAQIEIYAGYPHAAVTAVNKADPDWRLKQGWGIRTDAYHLTNDLQNELKAVRREQQLGLNVDYELGQVLPALGMVSEVNALIKDRMKRPSFGENTPGALMLFAAREYRAHGYNKESDELGNRAVAWYQSAPFSDSTEDARTANLVSALMHVGRLAEAAGVLEAYSRKYPEARQSLAAMERMGRIAARMGDSAKARSYMDQLRRLETKPAPAASRERSTYSRALIAAGIGDRAMAVTLLQQAISEGTYFEPYLHREIEFQQIKDYPPLKELLWPEG